MRQLDAQNREAIKKAGGVDSDILLKLLNEASLRGFELGGQFTVTAYRSIAAMQKAAA